MVYTQNKFYMSLDKRVNGKNIDGSGMKMYYDVLLMSSYATFLDKFHPSSLKYSSSVIL